MTPSVTIRGFEIYKGYLDREAQRKIVEALRGLAVKAPFFSPETSSGKKMSVRMTSAGKLGWISDRSGYRYEEKAPFRRALAADPGRCSVCLERAFRGRRSTR